MKNHATENVPFRTAPNASFCFIFKKFFVRRRSVVLPLLRQTVSTLRSFSIVDQLERFKRINAIFDAMKTQMQKSNETAFLDASMTLAE